MRIWMRTEAVFSDFLFLQFLEVEMALHTLFYTSVCKSMSWQMTFYIGYETSSNSNEPGPYGTESYQSVVF